ncbi:MAG: outer membrane protein assembly factor BamD [Parvularculaceae bacterium]
MKSRIGVVLMALTMAIAVAACSSSKRKQKFAYVEQPVGELYQRGAEQLEKRRFEEAVALFEEVERQHPYSAWARRSMLMKAFAYYQSNEYEDAVKALDQFISLHPGNKDAPYAYYLKAMCFYEQIRDVGRDQDFTTKAVAGLNDVVRRYPNTEYARDARLKLDLTFDHLAGKEMYIGRFYLKQNQHIAAINRFRYVINHYQTTSHVPEALHRLVEAYLEIGVVEEARAAAAVLGHNYPGSLWYQDTYALFKRRGLLKGGASLANASDEKVREEKGAAVAAADDQGP